MEQALDLYRQLQDRPGEVRSLAYLGSAYLGLGNTTKVIELSQQAVSVAREINNPELEKLALQGLALAQKQTKSDPQKTNVFSLMRQGVQQYQSGQFEAAIQT